MSRGRTLLLTAARPDARAICLSLQKPKRKFCNTSAFSLKGDYAYEACGTFCKQAKAVNHCKCAPPWQCPHTTVRNAHLLACVYVRASLQMQGMHLLQCDRVVVICVTRSAAREANAQGQEDGRHCA